MGFLNLSSDIMSDDDLDVGIQLMLAQTFAAAKLRPRPGEGRAAFLRRQTHVYMQHQGLAGVLHGNIPDLLPRLSVMYAYGNRLTDISALSRLSELKLLYLQDNMLTSISQLGALTALQKLDVDGNCIDKVTGFENMRSLSVLHISRQKLIDGQALMFDGASLKGLSSSLSTLKASSSRLTTVAGLWQLRSLEVADFSRNKLCNPDDCLSFVSQSAQLVDLDLRENPVNSIRKFLDQVITVGSSLQILNGSNIKDETRVYLRELAKRRLRIANFSAGCQVPGKNSRESGHGGCLESANVCQAMNQRRPSAELQRSRKASGGDCRITSQEENTHVKSDSIECVGAALHQHGCINEDGRPVYWSRTSAGHSCHLEEAQDRLQTSLQPTGKLQTARIVGDKAFGGNRQHGKASATRVNAPS